MSVTQGTINAAAHAYIKEIQEHRGVSDFEIVCDSANNPPEALAQGKLNVDVTINHPVRGEVTKRLHQEGFFGQ